MDDYTQSNGSFVLIPILFYKGMARMLKIKENGEKFVGAHIGSLPQFVSNEQCQKMFPTPSV
jgi:hypothetical protein